MSDICELDKSEFKLVAEELWVKISKDGNFFELKELIEKSERFPDTELYNSVWIM